MQGSNDFLTTPNFVTQAEATNATITRPGTTLRELKVDYGGPLRQREPARVSSSTKMSVTNKVTPPLVTPFVDDGVSVEDALTKIIDKLGEP